MGGYMRVSRKAGRDEDQWLTIPIQRDAIERWCARQEHTLVEVRQDIDVSGGTLDRANLNELVAKIQARELDGLVVGKLDRFARDLVDGARVIRKIEEAQGWFVAAGDGIVIGPDGRDESGADDAARLQLHIMLAVADNFLRANKRSWRETRKRTIERGVHWGPVPPFGYTRGTDGVLVVDESQAALVREAFRRKIAGEPNGSIARWLQGEGVRTARNGIPTHRWVAHLLHNRVYLGEARAGQFVNLDAHEPIVEEFTFARARGARVIKPARTEGATAPLLSGLLRCHACRGTMTSGWQIKDGQRARIYRCRTVYANGRCPAPATVLEDEVAPHIERAFWAILDGDLTVGEPVGHAALDDLRTNRDRAEHELVTYRDDPDILSAVEPRIYAQGLTVRQARFDAADAALRAAEAQLPAEAMVGLRELWPDLDTRERGLLLRKGIGCVVVARSGERYTPPEQRVPLGSRVRLLFVGDVPADLPRSGDRGEPLRGFPSFDGGDLPFTAFAD
jgi:site-specific DNA recombinase